MVFEQRRLYEGARLIGSLFGEYFGASLGTGDFDGDGRDDLAVGAPHWGDVDFGRVYIYQSSTGVSTSCLYFKLLFRLNFHPQRMFL